MTDLNKIFADVLTGLNNTLDGCNFAITRMANRPVIFDPTDGNVVLTEGGVWPIPREVGRVAMFKSRAGAEDALAEMKERLADNHIAQRLEVTGLKNAARVCKARTEETLTTTQEMIDKQG